MVEVEVVLDVIGGELMLVFFVKVYLGLMDEEIKCVDCVVW